MAARSGQTTVTTAGTAVVLGSQDIKGPLAIAAKDGNSGVVYVGNDGAGDVTSSNGYELKAGNQIVLTEVDNLNEIYVDSAENGDGVCWLILGDPR